VVVVASNLSSGSGGLVIFFSTGSPDRVSALSSPGTRPGIRPVIRKQPPGGGGHPVLVSRRLSATGIRFSVIRFPPRSWALLTVGLPSAPKHARTSTGVTAFRTRELRPGWVPSIPRGRRCSPRSGRTLQPAPAASQRPVLTSPPPTTHRRGPFTRHQRRFKQFTRPVFPSPGAPGQNGNALGFPPSFAPRRPRAGRRTSGRGQAIEHGPGTTRSTSHSG
jgi:hypothetical protein